MRTVIAIKMAKRMRTVSKLVKTLTSRLSPIAIPLALQEVAGPGRIELPVPVLETGGLPLTDGPMITLTLASSPQRAGYASDTTCSIF